MTVIEEPDWEYVQKIAKGYILKKYPMAYADDLTQVFAIAAFQFWETHKGTPKFTRHNMFNRAKYDVIDHLRRENGREGTPKLKRKVAQPLSLNYIDELRERSGGEAFTASLPDLDAIDPEKWVGAKDAIHTIMCRLPMLHRWMVHRRIVHKDDLKTLGDRLGLSESRVCQLWNAALEKIMFLEKQMSEGKLRDSGALELHVIQLLDSLPLTKQYHVISKCGRQLARWGSIPGVPRSTISDLNQMVDEICDAEFHNLGERRGARLMRFGVSLNTEATTEFTTDIPEKEIDKHVLSDEERERRATYAEVLRRKKAQAEADAQAKQAAKRELAEARKAGKAVRERKPRTQQPGAPKIAGWTYEQNWPHPYMLTSAIRNRTKIWYVIATADGLSQAEVDRELSRRGVRMSPTGVFLALAALRDEGYLEANMQNGLNIWYATDKQFMPKASELISMHLSGKDSVDVRALKEYAAEVVPGVCNGTVYKTLKDQGFTNIGGSTWERTNIVASED